MDRLSGDDGLVGPWHPTGSPITDSIIRQSWMAARHPVPMNAEEQHQVNDPRGRLIDA
jgi:hypothetical protein